jgi:hypothetical protein
VGQRPNGGSQRIDVVTASHDRSTPGLRTRETPMPPEKAPYFPRIRSARIAATRRRTSTPNSKLYVAIDWDTKFEYLTKGSPGANKI